MSFRILGEVWKRSSRRYNCSLSPIPGQGPSKRREIVVGALKLLQDRSMSVWTRDANYSTSTWKRRNNNHYSYDYDYGSKQSRMATRHGENTFLSPHTIQNRSMSVSSWLPDLGLSVWGNSGFLLKVFHMDGLVPYWACFALLNILVRVCLFPAVIYGAKTSSKFAKVLPEVQFLFTLFSNDMKQMIQRKAPVGERLRLLNINLKSLSRIYKGYGVNPLSIFLSPLLQLPIFWYISVDLRKIVNGLDPALAQDLVDSSMAWVTDLTEPDPWYGLSVLCGVLLYANVETAVGRRNLVGPEASKANSSLLIKDMFQCVAVFMPCFTSQMPAGIQIYVATTFAFTAVQSELLRASTFRSLVGLPLLGGDVSLEAPKYAREFIRMKNLEQEAIKIRGSGPLLGQGVLDPMYQGSFPGKNRPSTIQGSGATQVLRSAPSKTVDTKTGRSSMQERDRKTLEHLPFGKAPFVHGISAPIWQQQEQAHMFLPASKTEAMASTDANQGEDLISKANRGINPNPVRFAPGPNKPQNKLNVKKFQKQKPAAKRKKKNTKKR